MINNMGWRGRGVCRARRSLRLALLAPDLVEAILAGRTNQALMLETLERPLPGRWEEQRRLLPVDVT